MLRIAVCDDEIKELNQTEKLLNAYLQAHPQLNGQVSTFSDAKSLLAQREVQGHFDLYVLDIIMPEMSGIETGRQLRALGDHGEIIFLTNSNEFAADSYDVRAFFYLLKPVEKDKLFQVMNGVEKEASTAKQRHSGKYHQRNSPYLIRTNSLCGTCGAFYPLSLC